MTSKSQAAQDIFVIAMTEGMRNGFYVDIGANHPVAINNTYLLESEFGWTGILVDILPGCEVRKGKFFRCDSSNPTPELIEAYQNMPEVVDFLSLDVDDATLSTFQTLPWNKKRFRISCIEHDAYAKGPEVRDQIRIMMNGMGYVTVCGDVGIRFPNESCPIGAFEDWFCDPELIKSDMIGKFRCDGKHWRDIAAMC